MLTMRWSVLYVVCCTSQTSLQLDVAMGFTWYAYLISKSSWSCWIHSSGYSGLTLTPCNLHQRLNEELNVTIMMFEVLIKECPDIMAYGKHLTQSGWYIFYIYTIWLVVFW